MKPKIKVAFASGTDELNARLIARMRHEFPQLPLYVVSDFEPKEEGIHWVRYLGGMRENWARWRHAFRGKSIRLAGVLLVPNTPFWRMRLLAFLIAPLYILAVNENLDDFMLRPRCIPAMARHLVWRVSNLLRWHLGAAGTLARLTRADFWYATALVCGWLRTGHRRVTPLPEAPSPEPRTCLGGNGLAPDDRAILECAFARVPDLFCATLSEAGGDGARYALHGGAARSLYDTAKVCKLGGLDPAYETDEAAVADLCYRAWQRGWATVSVAGTSPPAERREGEPTGAEERDRLRMVARAVFDRRVFRRRWRQAIGGLRVAARGGTVARAALRRAPAIALRSAPPCDCEFSEELFLALTDGSVAVYPGKAPSGKPRVLVASAYLPFPLSHGGAVRMHNLTERAAAEWDQVLVAFTETGDPPARELLERFVEVVLVRRDGTHAARHDRRPEVVEHFASQAFRAALRAAVRQWRPAIAQLEFTQMAQYAADCAPARTVLVEHDITFDLYQQLAPDSDDWDLRRELGLWRRFETAAWRELGCVVTMSDRDRAMVSGARVEVLPNGVDLDRFRVPPGEPEPRRLLFVGSFCHVPNLIAIGSFLDDVWPKLRDARLHIIAGERHEYFLDYHRCKDKLRLDQPGVEVEGFVPDVRGAYGRAAIVVTPLVASAGTNLKVLEAMACGRPVVSTPAGVHGLDLVAGEEFVLARNADEMAQAIERLLGSPAECLRLAEAGRRRVERSYGWDAIALRQTELYRELMAC